MPSTNGDAPKRVLDIGNCAPDHAAIRGLVEGHFEAVVDQAHRWNDAEPAIRSGQYHLVLINRKLDIDYSDGVDILRKLKADPQLQHLPVMLITNYADHQQAAVELGALLGFGKLELHLPATRQKLAAALEAPISTAD